jgi:DNA-binding response OmpR family regulator
MLRSQLLADLEQHLSYYWRNLDPEAQYILAALPLFDQAAHLPTLDRLTTAGLINERTYLGSVLELFVRQQKVEGLLQSGPFLLDLHRGLAAVHGQPVHLTPTEFAALKLFLEQPGQLLTAEAIEAALWPGEIAPDPERARGVIKKLRAALGPTGEAIINRRGQGWLLALKSED